MTKVGLIGYGMAGQVFHAPMIVASNLELIAVQTKNPKNISIAQERYPKTLIVNDEDAMLAIEEIELIVVATPNTSHFPLAKKALLAGKNVVVDKPFTITASEADELIELAKSKHLLLSVFQNRRFDSDFLTISKLLNNNILGDVVSFYSRFDRFRPTPKHNAWREDATPGSGVMYDLGAHLIDQALVLFGHPQALVADIRAQRSEAVTDDYFELDLYYPNLVVTLGASCLSASPTPRFRINGTQGAFVKYGLDIQEDTLKSGIFPQEGEVWGEEPTDMHGQLYTQNDAGVVIENIVESELGDYRKYYRNIADALKGDSMLEIQPIQSRNVIRIIELAFASSQQKKSIEITDLK